MAGSRKYRSVLCSAVRIILCVWTVCGYACWDGAIPCVFVTTFGDIYAWFTIEHNPKRSCKQEGVRKPEFDSSIASLLAVHSAQLLLQNHHLFNGGFDHQAQLMQSLPVSLIGYAASRNPGHDAKCNAVIIVTLLG